MAMVPAVTAPAAIAPVFRNLRRETALAFLVIGVLLGCFLRQSCCHPWYTTAPACGEIGSLGTPGGMRPRSRRPQGMPIFPACRRRRRGCYSVAEAWLA